MSAEDHGTTTATTGFPGFRFGSVSPSGAMVHESEVPFDLTPDALPPGVSLMPDKPRKIAIIGYTVSNRSAPWDSPDWHIMGMNNMHSVIQGTRWDSWIDVHDKRTLDADPDHKAWLRELHPFPIYMAEPSPEFPSSRPFPRAELIERFGTYFTNTVALQVAWAITQVEWAIGDGAEIGIYGVDMAQGSEYAAQRPSCEYHIGIAQGMGIRVTIADTSDLLKTASIYGSTEGQALRVKMDERVVELQERLAHVNAERDKLIQGVRNLENVSNQLTGALEQNNYYLGVWFPPEVGPGSTRAPNDIRSQVA